MKNNAEDCKKKENKISQSNTQKKFKSRRDRVNK